MHLVRCKGGCQEPQEEVGNRNRPLAVGTSGYDLRLEREHACRVIGGRIGVGERATERAPVAHLLVAHDVRDLGEQAHVRGDGGSVASVVIRGQGPNTTCRRRSHAGELGERR